MLDRLKFPFLALLTLVACLSIHEFGHTVAAYLSGGWISEFSILSLRPHVRIVGEATPSLRAFRAAAGTGLSLLVYLGFISLTRRASFVIQFVRSVASFFVGAELLGWILSSLVGSEGADDARLFLDVSGWNRYSVAAGCVALGLICATATFRSCRRTIRDIEEV